MRESELCAYMGGVYEMRAISACFSKKGKYPDKLLGLFDDSKVEDDEYLTEEQIEQARENLVASLQLMQASFEANKIKEHAP